jgi:hypothetical protein
MLHYLRGSLPGGVFLESLGRFKDRNGKVAPPIMERTVAPAHAHEGGGPGPGYVGPVKGFPKSHEHRCNSARR